MSTGGVAPTSIMLENSSMISASLTMCGVVDVGVRMP